MALLSDATLKFRAFEEIVTPFIPRQVSEADGKRVISYGLSSAGYDVRLGTEFEKVSLPTFEDTGFIDPKQNNPECFEKFETDQPFLLEPGGFLLGHTVETFRIPADVLVVCLGKSTYARSGVIVNITPIEPGFRGQVVVEIENQSHRRVMIYPGEGIAQFLFFETDQACDVTYADRNGKYQDQTGITHAKV